MGKRRCGPVSCSTAAHTQNTMKGK
jgi:hypothetical protein